MLNQCTYPSLKQQSIRTGSKLEKQGYLKEFAKLFLVCMHFQSALTIHCNGSAGETMGVRRLLI